MDSIGNITLQIPTAKEEQSQVSAEINRSITAIDQAAQNNASSIEVIQLISAQLNNLAQGQEKKSALFSNNLCNLIFVTPQNPT